MRKKTYPTLTEALRSALEESGDKFLSLEQATGVQRGSISRFLRGRQTLHLDLAEKLAAYYGIEAVRPLRKGR